MPLTSILTLAGFPDAQSTGVRDGVTLKVVGDMTIRSGHQRPRDPRDAADYVTARTSRLSIRGAITVS
jgi:hypothetical protein